MGRPEDDAFVREHEATVKKLARKLIAQLDLKTEVDDLVAYGYEGLLEARTRFDPERGVKFTTFAYYRIRGAMLDGVRQMAYLPRRVHARRKAAEAVDRAAEEEASKRGAGPAAGQSPLAAIDAVLGKTSAAYVIAAVGQDERADAPKTPEARLVGAEEAARLRAAVKLLPERERALVEGHYFGDRTLEEIGEEMGISKSWASRLCSRALGRLREALG